MTRQSGIPRILALFLLIGLWAGGSPVLAQQQEQQQPESQQPGSPSSDPLPSGAKNEGGKKDAEKSGGTVGKSKLEKETCTVNDRIFEVLPNYETVDNANAVPPLTAAKNYRPNSASVFDWGEIPFNAAIAGIAQVN